MDRSILLELPILLFCFRALSGSLLQRKAAVIEIAQCSMWHFQFSGEVCSRRRGTASMEECCMFGFGRNGTPLLIVMGCQKNCADVKGIRWSVYFVNFRGCRGYDLCNEDF
uniref:Prostate and testis expressed 1 n=1 Tax=Callithrix jacchus TaxID=9483 RepID=F7DBL4_CALJA